MVTIKIALQQLHGQDLPQWYQGINVALEELVRLAAEVSACPHSQANEARLRYQVLADADAALSEVRTIIANRLIRNAQAITSRQYGLLHLSLFLSLLDSWLRAAEEFSRLPHARSSPRFSKTCSGFMNAYNELVAVARPHIAQEHYNHDNLLDLFDKTGLTVLRGPVDVTK